MKLSDKERENLDFYSKKLNKSIHTNTELSLHDRISLKGDILFLHIFLSYTNSKFTK